MINRSNSPVIFILLFLIISFSEAKSKILITEHNNSSFQSNSSVININDQISLLSPFGGEYFLKESKINIEWIGVILFKLKVKRYIIICGRYSCLNKF